MRFSKLLTICGAVCAVAATSTASAQWEGEAQAGGSVGASTGAGGGGGRARAGGGGGGGGGGVAIGFQARLDAFNLFVAGEDGFYIEDVPGMGDTFIPANVVPTVTAGVRLVDSRLFLGLGLGFSSVSVTHCSGDPEGCDAEEESVSLTSWSLSPLVTFDLVHNDLAALYLAGWLNLGTFNSTTYERVRPGEVNTTEIDGQFWWGPNVGIGLRGFLTQALALGTELGWGFTTTVDDGDEPGDRDDTSLFIHGFWATLVLDVAVPL